MPLRDNELARREVHALLLRPTPLRIKWEFADLASSDGHTLTITFTCSLRPVPDPIERKMLEEVLLNGRTRVTTEEVSAHVAPQLRSAAGRVGQAHPAEAWMEQENLKSELIDALKTSANAVAFACGLEVLAPFSADVQSSSFQRQQMRKMQQAMIEKEAAGQMEQFQRASDMLKQFQSLRAAAPELSAGNILQQVSTHDRGAMLQTLLLASAKREQTQAVWAVAGPYLVRLDPHPEPEERWTSKPQLVPLPPTLGPLRSISVASIDDQPALLVGARSGVMIVRPDSREEPRLYADPELDSPHGFNSVVYIAARREICATHADGGVVCWEQDRLDKPSVAVRALELSPDAPAPAAQTMPNSFASLAGTYMTYAGSGSRGGPGGPRNLVDFNGRILFSIGPRVYLWKQDRADALPIDIGSEILALLPADTHLVVVGEDGMLGILDRDTLQVIRQERRAARLSAAAALPWLDSTRLLLAGQEGPIQCVGLDDPLVTHYAGPYRGLRALAASPTVVASVSPDRQRLILWNSWETRQPAAEVFLTSLTRHRIADLAI